MMEFSKTIKGFDALEPDVIEVKIKRLPKPSVSMPHLPTK